MEVDLNKLISHFANNHFMVQAVFYNKISPGNKGFEKTAPLPGFIFPIRGRSQYSFNKIPYISEIGSIVHGGANMDLDKQVIGSSNWEFIVVLYDTSYSNKNELDLHNMHFKLNIGGNPKLTSLLWRLKDVSKEKHEIGRFQTENIFRSILEEVFTSVQQPQDKGIDSLFEQVSLYIHNHYMDDITVKELAEKNEVNENQLFYAFNKYAGMGTGEYIIKYRLNCAKQLLINSENTICIIAESVGYTDPLYFSRIFKKNFGVAPSIYREKFRNSPYAI
ncbi:MAG: helix-turn-helix domain-containing protein [Tissierellaceae bacterium]